MTRVVLCITLLTGLFPAVCLGSATLPVIGEIETLRLVKEKLQFPARIDTGAQTSSLSAVGIQPFERDGKRWMRFHVINSVTGKQLTLERPLERLVEIKQHGALAAKRPVVMLLVAIGNIRMECEFSLVDRSDYKFPALIGRNFLKGKAMVDVSRKQLAHPLHEGEEINK